MGGMGKGQYGSWGVAGLLIHRKGNAVSVVVVVRKGREAGIIEDGAADKISFGLASLEQGANPVVYKLGRKGRRGEKERQLNQAVDSIVKAPVTLLEYSLSGVTEGIDALATTRVLIRGENGFMSTQATGEQIRRTFSGSGSEMDIVVSSVRAYVSALNKMLAYQNKSTQKAPVQNSHVSASDVVPAGST